MRWLWFNWTSRLAWWLWGEVENPNWLQNLALYPEDIKSWRHGFWQLGMIVAEWAERLSLYIQDNFNDAGGGEWYRLINPAFATTEDAE